MARKSVVHKKPVKEKEYICHIHDSISLYLEELQEFDFTQATITEVSGLQTKMKELVRISLNRISDAKERGIAMERRLREYRSVINSLGYIRQGE